MERKAEVYLVWQPRRKKHFIVTLNPRCESIILLSFFPSKCTGQTFMCVCMCVYVHVYAHVRTRMHMCAQVCARACMCGACVYMYTHACMCVCQ